jgi:hypothetical protein
MFYCLLISVVFAMTTNDLYVWMKKNSSVANSQTILHRYPGLEHTFSKNLIQWTQNQLAKSASKALQNYKNGNCTEGAFFKVVDSNKVSSANSEVEKTFTDSLFLIESSYCISNVELQKAFDVYMSTDFRLDVMPRVTNVSVNNTGFCVSTEGITGLILPAVQCSQTKIKQQENVIIVHNTLDSVKTGPSYQPLYYREEIIVFAELQNGVALYRGTFTRSEDIGVTSKYVLSNTVESSQNDIRDQYKEWLSR